MQDRDKKLIIYNIIYMGSLLGLSLLGPGDYPFSRFLVKIIAITVIMFGTIHFVDYVIRITDKSYNKNYVEKERTP